MEQRPPPRPDAVRITDRDRRLLAFAARHRLIHAGHVAALLGVSRRRAAAVLGRLVGAGYLHRESVFYRQPSNYRIARKGVDVIGSPLPPPGKDLRAYEHDIGVAWLWLAARGGTFGPVREVLAERQLRSHDEAPGRSEQPLAVRLGGHGPGGRERLHYPDMLLLRPDGRRIAIELELSRKGRHRLEHILAGYGADPRIDAVLYLVEEPNIGRSVIAAANRLGIASRVHVQLVRHEAGPTRLAPARALQRTRRRAGETALARRGEAR